MLVNEYNNHRDADGNSWDFYHHNNSPSITIQVGGVIPFKDEEDKKDFYLHKKYLRWLVGRPYKQPSFEEWKKLQTN